MDLSEAARDRVLLVVAILAAGLIQVSIAGSQIFLGAGIALFLIFRRKLPFPRIWLPLLLFFLWTILADALSPDPLGGYPQIKKFFVFLFIPLIYGVFRERFSKVYFLMAAWTLAATASGVLGLIQFVLKYLAAKRTGQNFYVMYVGGRITGFESHWMTFGALQLAVLSLVLAQCFFSNRRMPPWAYLSVPVLSAAIVLGWTRSIWLATVPAALYLVWFWRPKMTLLVPLVAVAAFFVAPAGTRARLTSLFEPHGDTDSNRHRIVTFRTGLEMIKAHPWFGIGPEEIKRNFDAYVPADIQRPLPVGYYGHLHNIYVQYAAERGLPGLLLILWFIGQTVWDCARAIQARRHEGPSQILFVLHGTIAVTIGILVGGIFEYNLGDSEVLMMFVSVVALGYAAVYDANQVHPPAEAALSAQLKAA
ncbi:MAG: O-antigen ligase family protein [Acidobacteriaceae bacterium]|nr:O-antigen ligase family protein [Acidobacteriaceae bacterium]MBV9501452.1 O-antigen ligase family protein [Acidobacteriaceae bacterium]